MSDSSDDCKYKFGHMRVEALAQLPRFQVYEKFLASVATPPPVEVNLRSLVQGSE